MSVEIMGKVWGMALPHQHKMVLISMADHADHEGKRIYPSLGLIAWKTDYSIRQVRRIVGELVTMKILLKRKSLPGRPSSYDIDLRHAPMKPPYRQRLEKKVGHDDLGTDEADVSNELQINDLETNLGHDDLGSSVLGNDDLGHDDLGHDDLDLGHHVLPTPDIYDISHNKDARAEPSFEPKTESLEGNSKKGSRSHKSYTDYPGFCELWELAVVRPGGSKGIKQKALDYWRQQRIESNPSLLSQVLETYAYQKTTPQWQKNGGEFVKELQSWILNKVWEGVTVPEGFDRHHPWQPTQRTYEPHPGGGIKSESF